MLLWLAAFRGAEIPPRGTGPDPIDGARLPLLDRGKGALALQRKAALAGGKGRGMLAGHHLSDLTRLETRDVNLTADHVNGCFSCIDRDSAEDFSRAHGFA